MTTYETKLKEELPRGSYLRDPADPHQQEMGIWGRTFDGIELENKMLLEGIASPKHAAEWMIASYERQYQISPQTSATLADRQSAVITAMGLRRNLSISTIQAMAAGFLGYLPNIKTSPHAFYLGRSTFDSGHNMVEDWIKFGFWIELDATQTGKPYDDTALVAALLESGPADVQHVWTYWSDEPFDWNDYTA